MTQASVKKRINFVAFFLLIFSALLLTRLFYIQVLEKESYKALAESQYFDASSDFERGEIFFKEKNSNLISAATQKHGFFSALNPRVLENPEETYEKLSRILVLEKEEFMKKATKKDDPFEVVSHRLEPSQAEEIKKMAIKGVSVFPESWRFYPAKNLASHLLGFVGFDGDRLVGRYGLEKYYEEVLTGKKLKIDDKQSLGDVLGLLSKKIFNPSQKGHNLVLTIEPKVQGFLEAELEKLQNQWQAESASGLIIEPKTGKILALAKKPDFNPNFYNEVSDLFLFVNPLLENIFEMGSVFKPLTLAAGLNEGKITRDTTYFDKGYVVLNEKKIQNHDAKGRGEVNMQEVLNQSLNTGAVFAMQKLGKELFLDYIKKYGLSEKTGIDLPNEAKGNISNLKNGQEVEFATASFGQGIAVTPLALAAAFSSLANGGFIIKPMVAERIQISGGNDVVFEPEIKGKILEQRTSEEITRMLVEAVDKALLGGTLKLNNYSVAGKTGTAQILDPETGEYSENQYLHTFFGYAPAFEARFLVFLSLEKPQGVRYASQSLGTPFMETMKFLLNYYEVPPDR